MGPGPGPGPWAPWGPQGSDPGATGPIFRLFWTRKCPKVDFLGGFPFFSATHRNGFGAPGAQGAPGGPKGSLGAPRGPKGPPRSPWGPLGPLGPPCWGVPVRAVYTGRSKMCKNIGILGQGPARDLGRNSGQDPGSGVPIGSTATHLVAHSEALSGCIRSQEFSIVSTKNYFITRVFNNLSFQ